MVTRGPDGKFVKGHSGGPGRPPRETEQYFVDLFRTSVSDADFQEVVAALVKAAKRGNTMATKIILEYLMGTPKQKADIAADLHVSMVEIVKEVAGE